MLQETNQALARKRIIWIAVIAICAGVALALASQFVFSKEKDVYKMANAAHAQNKASVDEVDFDDWRVACTKDRSQCQMFQRISTQKGKRPLLTAIVTYIGKEGAKVPVMRFVVPMGVRLPAGLGFRIDDQKAQNIPFQICGPGGCITESPFDDAVLANLRKSKNIIISFKLAGQKPLSVAVSLKGFAAAFDNLKL